MLHLSSYHSNGLPAVVWSNRVNLIGEKVYKPKIHFCEHCNKPILIYGRLIPCKHVFCFTCATLCLTKTQQSIKSASSPPPAPNESPPHTGMLLNHHTNNGHSSGLGVSGGGSSGNKRYHSSYRSPSINQASPNNDNSNKNSNGNISLFISRHSNSSPHYHGKQSRGDIHSNNSNNDLSKNDLHRSDSNQSISIRDKNGSCSLSIDESTSNATPINVQHDAINSPNFSGSSSNKGCHRCGGKALRVERNNLNSIFVCSIETCRRTYLSARDLQAHVTHRHSRNKSAPNNNKPNQSVQRSDQSDHNNSQRKRASGRRRERPNLSARLTRDNPYGNFHNESARSSHRRDRFWRL